MVWGISQWVAVVEVPRHWLRARVFGFVGEELFSR
jgi:hypothetical protein